MRLSGKQLQFLLQFFQEAIRADLAVVSDEGPNLGEVSERERALGNGRHAYDFFSASARRLASSRRPAALTLPMSKGVSGPLSMPFCSSARNHSSLPRRSHVNLAASG